MTQLPSSFRRSVFGIVYTHIGSWDRSVRIVTRLRAGRSGFHSRQGHGYFSLRHLVYRLALRPTQPPVQWVSGAPSLGV
jgi:hypothetical protein